MKSPETLGKLQSKIKSKRCFNEAMLLPLSFAALITILCCFLIYSLNPFCLEYKPNTWAKDAFTDPQQIENESCDWFKGHWVPDHRGLIYTNTSCATIPDNRNCFKLGREDRDFLYLRWKPDDCELPRFDPKTFLQIVGGKRMAIIGDSVARNHIASLLCMLSEGEIPVEVKKSADESSEDGDLDHQDREWHFPTSNFTLMFFWSKFLVTAEERTLNGSSSNSWDLYLDKPERNWVSNLPTFNYAIFSGAHWFNREIFLHKGNNIVGCVYCKSPNITYHNPEFGIQLVFQSVLRHINDCKNCEGIVTLVRTFSPAHFENGVWNTGGTCNRKHPYAEGEIELEESMKIYRRVQIEAVESAKEEGKKRGKKFLVLDVTRAMMMRADGHPGANYANEWMRTRKHSDCVHWCLPGPIDMWNELLVALLRTEAGFQS